MNSEMAMVVKRNEEREALRSVIQQWNANRLDLFELSEPNENLEFHGVMRFYFQDSGQKVATKCIRVASDATVQDVIETLIEKFRPDMRMLSLPEYALFEIHENGEERKLAMDEKPLLVQLNWHKDDREGRFLLRRLDDKTNMPSNTFQQDGSSFRRKLSKREKKQLKKQEKLNRLKSNGANDENDARVAEKLYSELPETSFTRSISNPEAVMRRRRQQQFERRLLQFRSKDGGPDTGGTLKIYGESLCRDVPYKTLLLSIRETAQQVVREMLLKYGLDKEDPHNYCLVQVNAFNEYSKENNHQNISNNNNNINNSNNNTLNSQEYILDDDECPLAIIMTHSQSQGSIMFHVRRRPADYHPRKRKKKPQHKWNQQQSVSNELLEYRYEDGLDRLPLFLELNPDGSEICGGAAKRHRLHPNVTEVGCERNSSPSQSQYLQLFGPNILPRHCVIANTEGIVTVTPCSRDSETYVNGQRIYETTILRNGAIVKFGRIHCFRFLDPYFEERIRQRQDSLRNIHEYTYDRQSTKEDSASSQVAMTTAEMRRNSAAAADAQTPYNFETTFDVDGNVETRSTSSQGNKEDSRSQRSVGSGSKDGNRVPSAAATYQQRQGADAILPAVLEIREETEDELLKQIVSALDPNTPTFKLAPAYCLYLMARYRASTHYRPELTPTQRAHKLTKMLEKVANKIQKVIQERYNDITSLALWLANSSELLFFLQFDRHLIAYSKDARRILAESVQLSFRHLIGCVQSDLSTAMPHFFADRDDTSHDHDESSAVLFVLSSAMTLLRKYRVNVALTVQLFSHLFHFINVWAFNRLIAPNTNYCSRAWGLRLKARLAQIEIWAERQGLEISTDTHLARIVQAAHLLQAPKYNADDLASLSSTCFLLNSLQLKALLMKYQTANDEPPLLRDLIENVVKVAEKLADELARSNGLEVKLDEDPEFALEFVLPIDSYSCEVVRGIPPGLIQFVEPLQYPGLCRLSTQPTSNGLWTVYMELPSAKGAMIRSPSAMSNRSVGYLPGPQEPEIHVIKLHKSNNGMGLSIVAAKGAGQDKLGIYIKSVVKGGAADADGRLQAGDQLLKVDGQSLVGITQEKAAEYLVRTGPIVTLEVAKQGAIYHGLATLLSQPSPIMTRGGRRMSERDLPSRVANEQPNQATQLPMHAPVIHSSKSVPSLNSSGVNEGQVVTPVASRSSHEVFNPGYNSTSSPNNVHPQQAAALRSRSSQNLNDSRSLSNYPQPNMAHTLPNRQTPNSSMLTSTNSASPMYPPQYGQPAQQHPMYHQHVQQQQMLLHQQQQQQQHQHQQQQQHHYQYSIQNSSISETGERFYQNLNVYRNPDMPNGVIHEVVAGGPTMKGKMMSPQQERASNQFQRSFRGSQTSLQQQQLPQGRQSAEMYMRDRPASAYMQKENYPPQPMGMSGRSQSTRDMLRQEAKLQEMSEEVRRRGEMRSNFSPQQQHYPISPNRIQSPAENNSDPNALQYQPRPGPLSPMMYGNDGQPVRMVYANHKGPLMRPSIEEMGYRESPPPPPPPPTSTHPLYQSSTVQRSPDSRYQASVGEPPKGGYYPSSPVTSSSKHYQIQGTNPWEREEREKEAERRREACKEWRDQQINELVSLGQGRNQSQEEQLRALRLEKEFERRALEEEDDEDEDQETAERIQDVMRTAREQDDLRNTGGSKSNSYTPPGRWTNSHPPQMNGSAGGGARLQGSGAQNIMEEKERLRRLKEMKMKQAEQESMKMDETRFRHKEEDHNTSGLNGHHTPDSTKTLSRPTHLKLDNSSSRNHVANSSYSNLQDYSTLTAATAAAPQQRLDNLLDAPPPPERGSSFAVMSQAYRSPVTTPSSHTITPKKVSFQETTSETPTEKVMEDPNRFISEAENLLASPKSPDTQFMNSTPGVIGNQEVYKDPRQRRLQEQQHQKLLSNKVGPVPEKLTFKEKMKMFAMETGEEGTPKDKVKISRAQRDIDNLNSPSATNNGVDNKSPGTVNENVEKIK